MFQLFVVLLLLCFKHTTAITCVTRTGIQTYTLPTCPSCAECEFRGCFNETGACLFVEPPPVQVFNQSQPITTSNCSLMEYGECETPEGTCVKCGPGVLARECNEGGYLLIREDLAGYECKCYSNQLDPARRCLPGQFFRGEYDSVEVIRSFEKVTCKAHQSDQLGCYEDVDSSHHKYGDPDPPVPYRCCLPILGPPPGELRERFVPGEPFQQCNIPGTANPDLIRKNDTSFHACSGHGIYNFTTRTCQCDKGWLLQPIGLDMKNRTLSSCTICDAFYGPSTITLYGDPPYCTSTYAPDPITGIDMECSGHGVYFPEGCVCYSNSTAGFWTLATVGFRHGGEEVKSCSMCQSGHQLPHCL